MPHKLGRVKTVQDFARIDVAARFRLTAESSPLRGHVIHRCGGSGASGSVRATSAPWLTASCCCRSAGVSYFRFAYALRFIVNDVVMVGIMGLVT